MATRLGGDALPQLGPEIGNRSRAVPSAGTRDSTALDVLYLVNSLTVGGSEKKTVNIANALAKRGVRVGVAYLNGPEDLLPRLQDDVPRWCLGRKGKYSWRALRALRELIASRRPRAIVAVNLYPLLYLVPAALCSGGGAGRPRTVALLNTSTPSESIPAMRRLLYAAALGGVDYVVHGCEANRMQWHRPGAGRHRSGVIYNGIDLASMTPEAVPPVADCRALFGVPDRQFVFGTVGRLAPEKNQKALLEALQAVRARGLDAHLLLVGAGRLRDKLEAVAGDLALTDHVTFTGALEDIRPALKAMDAFVLPSIAIETFSNAALEAMAMEKPVISSDVGGAPEMIRNRLDGFVVPKSGLRSQLPELLERLAAQPQLALRLGKAARDRVVERFSLDQMIDNHKALIP